MNNSYEIKLIGSSDQLFDDVVVLGTKHSKTLGFFPRGAFEESANKDYLLAACSQDNDELYGYLLYRVAKGYAHIVHLCIAPEHRGNGIAQTLFEALKERLSGDDLKGVCLKCRMDYGVDKVWQQLGFAVVRNVRGRSKDGHLLTVWLYKFDYDDLFSWQGTTLSDDYVWVVMDTNILAELRDPEENKSEETLALEADWLEDEIELTYTDEVKTEINRSDSEDTRNERLKFCQNYRELDYSQTKLEGIKREIRSLWDGRLSTPNDISDFHHVCKAIAAGGGVFVTRDEELIVRCVGLEEEYDLIVCRPVDIINKLHKISSSYSPAKLEGLGIDVRRVEPSEISSMAEVFANDRREEKRKALQAQLRAGLSAPDTDELNTLTIEGEATPTLLYSKRHDAETNCVDVDFLRTRQSAVSRVLCEQILGKIIHESLNSNEVVLFRVLDSFLSDEVELSLALMGFHKSESGWFKLSIAGVHTRTELQTRLHEVGEMVDLAGSGFDGYRNQIIDWLACGETEKLQEIEHMLFPVKIADAGLPCYIVPIRPYWASRLFDSTIAESDLFAPDLMKFCSRENIYYRSSRQRNVTMPGRILWYVSKGKSENTEEVGCIKASSGITSVDVDEAKKLFKRYKHLGVYEWHDVYKAADNDAAQELMAIKFVNSEQFGEPLYGEDFDQLGIKGNIQSPREIDESTFMEIYSRGSNL